MKIGRPQILTCPYCKGKKEIMSLVSGNTFGARQWSDNKLQAPMLPEISYVQKCPHCGKYYIMDRQKAKFAKKGECFEDGLLRYPEMKEAYLQLMEEGFRNKEEETNVRMMFHHSYNDIYRFLSLEEKTEEDNKMFCENALWLIENLITDDVMKAEFYREIGEFDTAREILKGVKPEEDFFVELVAKIQERIDKKDTEIFEI